MSFKPADLYGDESHAPYHHEKRPSPNASNCASMPITRATIAEGRVVHSSSIRHMELSSTVVATTFTIAMTCLYVQKEIQHQKLTNGGVHGTHSTCCNGKSHKHMPKCKSRGRRSERPRSDTTDHVCPSRARLIP